MKTILLTAAIAVAALGISTIARADNQGVKRDFYNAAAVCPAGQALTFTLQCDPGSRPPGDRIWNPTGPGIELCKTSETRCEPIRQASPTARPGFEVQDSGAPGLVAVSFGLDRLLGDVP